MVVNRKSSLRISTSSLLIWICAIVCFFPNGLRIEYSSVNRIINYAQCFAWALAVIKTVISRAKISRFTVSLHFFWLVFLICIAVSDLRRVNVNTWLTSFATVCCFALLTDIYGFNKIIRICYKYFLMLSIINIALMFTRSEGYTYTLTASDGLSSFKTRSNFLSTDNEYAPFMICFLLMSELQYRSFSGKKTTYMLSWFLVIVTTLKIFSATCIVGLLVYIILLYIVGYRVNGIRIKLKAKYFLIILPLIFVLIYYFQVQKLFSVLFVNILGKDLSLTGRIGLWQNAIDMIREKWIFGWGNYNKGAIILREYYYWYAHNLLLDILLEGGILTLGSFILCFREFMKAIKRQYMTSFIQYCLIACMAFAIMNIAESHLNNVYFYLPFILANGIAVKADRHIVRRNSLE